MPLVIIEARLTGIETNPHETDGTPGILLGMRDRAGADPAEWPEDLRIREWPAARVVAIERAA